ncbi:PQQ-binding-like beta-propeller repeat protein [Solwaraspora sp. WMMD791]|uniref:outer membrane protein assembly factor BamB family protein n=1 Tax=Solwaraspora sp. WMMD791 TaxID=3016086 RepID=UPI00249AEEA9|nr:PQQ-binding-like beta-propeller repeat protein [Solwaraspora sp. WMMD791]WFE27556.1 PQQ-binding-like beta-propeller repeat protein [Solwaraspora sp. WMMD791]
MTAVIDLGEVGRRPPEPGLPAGRRFGRRPARPWLAGLLVVVVLATVAAAPPQLPEPVHLGSGFEAQSLIAGDLLFVIDAGDDADVDGRPPANAGDDTGGRTIAAYTLPRGELRWRVPVPQPGDGRLGRTLTGLQHVADLLLVGFFDRAGAPGTTAVDIADGSVRWSADGFLVGAVADDAMALWMPRSEIDPRTREWVPSGVTLRVVEAGSGRTRWTVSTSAQAELHYRLDGDLLTDVVEVELGGRVRVRDARTGQLRTDGTTGRPMEPGPTWVVADLLVTMTDDALWSVDLATLTPRWSVPVPLVGGLTPCAPLLCLTQPAGGIRALDPADGTVRWSHDEWILNSEFGRYLLITSPRQPDRPSAQLVVDPATGEPVAADPYWTPFAATADGWLGLRYDPYQSAVWVARITPDGSPPRVLLRLADVVDNCQAGADVVVCRRVGGGLGVSALPD